MHITLDIASELYPLKAGESIFLTLARSLVTETDADADVEMDADGEKVQKVTREMWRGGDQGLAEQFDYVLYGKVYKFDDSNKGENQTYVQTCTAGGATLTRQYRLLLVRWPPDGSQRILPSSC
jgi:DNA-directed RNA polymerase I, II, and III subunit RPABC3